MMIEEEQFDDIDKLEIFQTMFLIDNSSEIQESTDKLQIQIEVCQYILSHEYDNKVFFGLTTSGIEEGGVRCSLTNSLKAPKLVLKNINCGGTCNFQNTIIETLLCFKNKTDNEINRIHCFLKNNYAIPTAKVNKIKNLLQKYNVIIDLFIISGNEVEKNQYKEILSENSIFKVFNTGENDPFVISQLIIDDIFDIYSAHLIPEKDENSNDKQTVDQNSEKNENKPKKVKRKRVQPADAQAIYQVFLTKDDNLAKELCDSLEYSTSTYYNIINNEGHVKQKYKSPERKKKWKSEQIDKAVEIIGENPVLTLEEIVDKTVIETNAKQIAKSTMSDYLKSELITMKSCRLDPIDRNSEETKNSRKKYCNEILRKINRTYVFIDEMGFSCCTQRNRGRSRKGTKCVRKGPLLKAPNVSICMAVSKDDKIIHYKVENNAFNGEKFAL